VFPDLKVLSIRTCPSVTPEGLLSVLALPFLQHFDYYTRRPVPKSFVRGIAAQNPSLESISVNQGDSETYNCTWSAEEKKDFFKEHPRIRALNNLVSIKHFLVVIYLLAHFNDNSDASKPVFVFAAGKAGSVHLVAKLRKIFWKLQTRFLTLFNIVQVWTVSMRLYVPPN